MGSHYDRMTEDGNDATTGSPTSNPRAGCSNHPERNNDSEELGGRNEPPTPSVGASIRQIPVAEPERAKHHRVLLRGRPLRERLDAHVDRSAGPDACWPWMGLRDRQGYGRIEHKGKGLGAHRVALECAVGPIAPGFVVLHSCDHPWCCNPQHLAAGTIIENNRDAKAKGRNARGEAFSSARLTTAQVLEIFRRSHAGEVALRLGEEFGVSDRLIGLIRTGKKWAHVTSALVSQ